MNRELNIKGIVLDFDGTILATEAAVYQAWQELYRSWGEELQFEEWVKLVGKSTQEINPMDILEEVVGEGFERAQARAQVSARELELVERLIPLPGVMEIMEAAQSSGVALAVASSSPRDWIETHLKRLGLQKHFQAVSCSDDVPRAKPDPALYNLSLEKLNLQPEEVVVFEDSPHGVLAAKRAGLYCIAVPNQITRRMTFHHNGGSPDLILESLEDFPLDSIRRDES
jgi:HAD superfamily hydrolase (TIGR01509 family)